MLQKFIKWWNESHAWTLKDNTYVYSADKASMWWNGLMFLIFWDGGLYIAIEETFKSITTAYILGLNELSEIDCDEIIYFLSLC